MSRHRFLLLVLALTALHGLLAVWVPVSGDEAYYWDCSRHLDWSYFDQPALVIWSMIPSRALLGESPLAVRAPAILASLLVALLLVPLVRRLGGELRHAAAVCLLLHAMPLFFLGAFYASTDVAMATAYTAATWAAVALAQGERRAWWGFGVACGLGFLAKFPIVLVAPALLPALRRRDVQAQLCTPTPYLAALVCLLLTAPVWIWGAQNEWDNVAFQLQGRHQGGGLGLEHLGAFLGGNLLLATPFLAAGFAVAWWRSRQRSEPGWQAFRIALAMPLLFFGLIALKEKVGLHWGGPALLLGAVALVLVPFGGRRVLVTLGAVTGLAVSLGAVALATWPEAVLETAGLDHGDAPRELRRLIGNEEIAREVASRRQAGELIASESYTTVHQLAFASGGALPTRLVRVTFGRHGLASLYWYRPEELRGRDVLFVTERPGFTPLLGQLFAACREEPPIRIERWGRVLREVRLIRCRDLEKPEGFFTK